MVIADTGFWLALASRSDRHHADAKAALASLREAFITTWPVMTETCHLMVKRLGATSQLKFLKSYAEGSFVVFDLSQTHAVRMQALMRDYVDLPMDLADASLVILAEHLGHGRILSTDRRDFQSYRWKNHRPFENLLLPD